MFTGAHPEAPASWRGGVTFTTPLSVDVAYAGTVIQAALHGTSLPHFQLTTRVHSCAASGRQISQ